MEFGRGGVAAVRFQPHKIPTTIQLKEIPKGFYNFAIGLYLLHMALMAELTAFFPAVLMRFRMISFLLVAALALAAIASRALLRGISLRAILVYAVFLLMAVSGIVYQPENLTYVKEIVFQGYFIKYVLLFSALFLFEEDPDVRIHQLTVISLASLLMYQYGISHGMFLNEDGLLHYMTVGYGCASWWVIWTQGIFYYKNKLIKLSCLLVSLYFAIFILNYGNRGALVVILVALAVLMMVYIPLKYLVLLGVVILLTTSAAFLFLQPLMELAGDLLGFDLTLSRNFRLLSNGLLGYDSGRLPIYRVCFEAILRHPLLGNGSQGDRAATFAALEYASNAHNAVIELCVNFGVVFGGLIYVWLLYVGFQMLFRCQNRDWRALFLPLYTYSMVMIFFSGEFYESGHLLSSIIIYLTYVSRNRCVDRQRTAVWIKPCTQKRSLVHSPDFQPGGVAYTKKETRDCL